MSLLITVSSTTCKKSVIGLSHLFRILHLYGYFHIHHTRSHHAPSFIYLNIITMTSPSCPSTYSRAAIKMISINSFVDLDRTLPASPQCLAVMAIRGRSRWSVLAVCCSKWALNKCPFVLHLYYTQDATLCFILRKVAAGDDQESGKSDIICGATSHWRLERKAKNTSRPCCERNNNKKNKFIFYRFQTSLSQNLNLVTEES